MAEKQPWWKAKTLAEALRKEPPKRQSFGEFLADKEAKKHGGVYFSGVVLTDTALTYKGVTYPLPAKATVETAGELQSRVTVTRLLATGVFAFALKKKSDKRELYLTVESASEDQPWAFVVDVNVKANPKAGIQAREFAARVNSRRPA